MAATVDAKLLRATKFPPEFNQKVDMQKVNLQVMKKWIASRISEILGSEDDVVIELCFNLIDGPRYPDIKSMQIQLTGFLDKDTPAFCKELWKLCLSAQSSPQGVPKELLEAKKLELIQEKVARTCHTALSTQLTLYSWTPIKPPKRPEFVERHKSAEIASWPKSENGNANGETAASVVGEEITGVADGAETGRLKTATEGLVAEAEGHRQDETEVHTSLIVTVMCLAGVVAAGKSFGAVIPQPVRFLQIRAVSPDPDHDHDRQATVVIAPGDTVCGLPVPLDTDLGAGHHLVIGSEDDQWDETEPIEAAAEAEVIVGTTRLPLAAVRIRKEVVDHALLPRSDVDIPTHQAAHDPQRAGIVAG
ncbi:PWI domain-containing protein [Poronia punctata]|nr:PWI domain-containing protein [Poronia punctata]